MRIKFVTYNIQYGVGQDGRYDLNNTQAALIDQDIICLQEVTTNWRACERDEQPEILASALNLFMVYAPAYQIDCSHKNTNGIITNSRRGFGNMILSRWPIIFSRPHSLPRPPTVVAAEFHPRVDFPRTALEAVIDINGTYLRVISVHLSQLPGPQKQAQIHVLKALAHGLPDEAPLWDLDPRISDWSEDQHAPRVPHSTLISGDFNFESDDADYVAMLEPASKNTDGLIDSWASSIVRLSDPLTCVENDGRLSRLDYMFITPDLGGCVKTARVDQATSASDHFPVYFELDL